MMPLQVKRKQFNCNGNLFTVNDIGFQYLISNLVAIDKETVSVKQEAIKS